jgi:hypothetical protein
MSNTEHQNDSDPPDWDDEPTGVIVRRLSREMRSHAKADDQRWAEVSAHMRQARDRVAWQGGAAAVLGAIALTILAGVTWLVSTTTENARDGALLRQQVERNTGDIAQHDSRLRDVEKNRGDGT